MNPLQRSLSHVTAREESKERLRESLSARQGGRFRPLAAALACFQGSAHWIILAEERWCLKNFGESYRQYMRRVHRYF